MSILQKVLPVLLPDASSLVCRERAARASDQSNYTYMSFVSLERTHEPCVPTCIQVAYPVFLCINMVVISMLERTARASAQAFCSPMLPCKQYQLKALVNYFWPTAQKLSIRLLANSAAKPTENGFYCETRTRFHEINARIFRYKYEKILCQPGTNGRSWHDFCHCLLARNEPFFML